MAYKHLLCAAGRQLWQTMAMTQWQPGCMASIASASGTSTRAAGKENALRMRRQKQEVAFLLTLCTNHQTYGTGTLMQDCVTQLWLMTGLPHMTQQLSFLKEISQPPSLLQMQWT